MAKISVKRVIPAPIDQVFERASDFANAAENIEGIEKVEMLTDGPVGVGTRFRETRIMFGREAKETMEITQFDRPNSYTTDARSHGCHYVCVIRFRTVEGGTEMEMEFNATPLTFMAKIMSALMKPMTKGLAKMILKDLDDLAATFEAEAAAAPSGA